MDYLVQTNLLSFLVLWKAKRYEQSQKYIKICKKYIYHFMNNEIATPNESIHIHNSDSSFDTKTMAQPPAAKIANVEKISEEVEGAYNSS